MTIIVEDSKQSDDAATSGNSVAKRALALVAYTEMTQRQTAFNTMCLCDFHRHFVTNDVR